MFSLEETDRFGWATPYSVQIAYSGGPVYFMLNRSGDSIEAHICAIGREGKLKSREASKQAIQWIIDGYPWCNKITSPVKIKSMYNLLIKLGFEDTGEFMFTKGKANILERAIR